MSLSGAINTAALGLRTTQTQSRVNAENVANSTTEGYARRRAMVVSGVAEAPGPVVSEIRREVDFALTRMSRNETGKVAKRQAIFDALSNYTSLLGQPGDNTSPAEKFSDFNSSLTTLVNSPASPEAQFGVVLAAEELATSLRQASENLSAVRADVDMEMRYEVSELNQALYGVADLNKRIAEVSRGTPEANRFEEQMDRLLDRIAGLADIRTYANGDGSLNLYTTGGAALIERSLVQDVRFEPSDGTIMAGDIEITPIKPGIRGLSEGSIAGLSELKRSILPRVQLQLDEYARGLIEAFETADLSISSGDPGLFTDGGAAFQTSNLENLAYRIQVNDLVKPSAGGDVWRVRDGMGVTTPGDASDNSQVQGFIDALDQPMSAVTGTGIGSLVTVADYGAQMVSAQGTERARSQENLFSARSSAEIVFASRANFEGVNIDEEMQELQIIQQSYAANSRVLTTVLGMIDTLLNAV